MNAAPFAGTARFRPLALIGRGGTGTVYRAHDEELGCAVALKTLESVGPEQVYRLKREFRFVAGLTHPNLAQLHELFVTDDLCFFTMEFVDGDDFVTHARGPTGAAPSDTTLHRVLDAAPQLIDGLAALHAAERLHGDVKPSNVRVTPAGRVVVLDFDLGIWLATDRRADATGGPTGTLAYMAPEQAWGRAVGAAADWYSTGVLLHEALTGELPFRGAPTHLFYSAGAIAAPQLTTASLPAWLAELLSELLHADPTQRPTHRHIRACLTRRDRVPTTENAALDTIPIDPPLVGRQEELASLRGLLDATGGATTIGLIDGPSGIGKTKIVQTLLAAAEHTNHTLVLRGRCHPQESVPYKALDGVIDALSTYLVRLPEEALVPLLPRNLDALARLFPMLARVPAIANARAETIEDSIETRRRGFLAIRELFHRIATAQRLVLWIDDLQWGDRDSAALLARLLEPPDAPPLALLASYRSDERDGIELLDHIERLALTAEGPRLVALHIEPLANDEAERLAWALSPPEARSPERIDAITRDAGGSPFLIATMARNTALQRPEAPRSIAGLNDVVADLVAGLPADTRHLIELVAVAGTPIERSVLVRALAQGNAGRPLLAALENRSLVRTLARGTEVMFEAYHDRIREGVLAHIPATALAGLNRTLAHALEASGHAEPERLAHHLHQGGELGRAADYAVAAADKASSALAFERAAEFYRLARTWDARDATWQRILLRREGDTLVNAGRFADGAERFLAAAASAPPLDALDLRRRASEQLLAAGRIDEGVGVLSALLRDLGLSYPSSPRRAMLSVAARIGGFLLRPLRAPVVRSADNLDERALVRTDTCYSAAKSLSDVDPMRGVYFSLRSLSEARAAGEPIRLGRSLSIVGGTIAALGGTLAARRGARMLAAAHEIANTTQSIELRGSIEVAEGQALMLSARWHEALTRSNAGIELLSKQCRGYGFECNIGRASAMRALEELGEMHALGDYARQLMEVAAAAGNQYAEIAAATHLVHVRLAADDLTGARDLVARCLGLWTREGFHLQHLYGLRAAAYCDLYADNPAPSHARLAAAWPALKGSGLLRVPLARTDAVSVRSRVAIATLDGNRTTRPGLLRAVARDARRLSGMGRIDATVHALLLLAACAVRHGRRDNVLTHLEAAIQAATTYEMRLHAAVARWRKGEIVGGSVGRELCLAAADDLTRAGIARPDRWVALYAPGFTSPATDPARTVDTPLP